MLVVALTANVALGQSRGPSGADGSYNCDDFDTQTQAQAYYDGQGGLSGGDPDGLDRDKDGQACEDSLPAGGNDGATPSQQGPACPGSEVNVLTPEGEYNCVPPDVEDQTPAEIDDVVNDPRSNAETPIVENQGIPQPGELTPAQAEASGNDYQPAPATGTSGAQYEEEASGDVASLPDTGGVPLSALALGGAALLIGGGLILRRRF
jgi:LPXTG-motif cell wall-anchored protein